MEAEAYTFQHFFPTPKSEALIQQYSSTCSQLQNQRLLHNRIFPTRLFSTLKLEALIQQYSSNTFALKSTFGGFYATVQFQDICSQLQNWRLLYTVWFYLFSTPKLEAVIQQNISNIFVLNSKIGGSCTIVQFQHICSQLHIWRLLYNSIIPTHLFSTLHLEAIIQQ